MIISYANIGSSGFALKKTRFGGTTEIPKEPKYLEREKTRDMNIIKIICFCLLAIIGLALPACTLGSSKQAAIASDATAALTLTLNAQNSGETFNTVGQAIIYNYIITNTGQTVLPGPVIITDDKMAVTCPELSSIGNTDGSLDPNESITCPHSYNITQADLNAGSVTNNATASVGGITSNPASVTVLMTQNKALTLTKNVSPSTYNQAGQVIIYTYVIKNSGIVTLPGPFSIADNKVTVTCTEPASGQLAPNEEMICTATYLITQADLATSSVINSATASGGGVTSNPATATITRSEGNSSQPPTSGNTIQHEVLEGEWLIQIARCYGADYIEVRLANPQISDPSQLKPGMIINVPRTGSVGTVFGTPCVVFQTVSASDTWNSIASTYNADLLVLQEANPGALSPGRVIKVPKNSAGANKNVPPAPTQPSKPVISTFTANASSVSHGNIILMSWSFSGQDLASARLTRTNPDGTQTPLYGGADVTTPGTYEDLAMQPGVVIYTLQVSSEFGGTTTATVVVNVIAQ